MVKIPFVKYHGAGNDFILIDFCRNCSLTPLPSLARRLCDRRHGIGADGLLLLLPSRSADYRMVILNADGSEPAMCGNGIRCLADYIFKYHNSLFEVAVETQAGIFQCRRVGDEIAVDLGIPTVLHFPIIIDEADVYVVNTGVPHAVLFVEDLEQISVALQGKAIRFHPHFTPGGVNVNFAKVMENGKVALRTYERGVEAETLACGTGAAAAAFAAMKVKQCNGPISILTRSSFDSSPSTYRETIRYSFTDNGAMEMVGSAEMVFEGIVAV